MVLARIWMVLVAAAAALGFSLALLVPKPAFREVAKAYAEKLDRSQHNADLKLRQQSRDWIDAVALMALDKPLVDLLEQASNNRGNITQHSERTKTRLQTLNHNVDPKNPPQLLLAVDTRGNLVAHIGFEKKFQPGIHGFAGYPLVEAALRGYRGDDTWNVSGKLYFVVGTPVISRARNRYVGALLLGQEVNDSFASQLKKRMGGTDLAFFLRGKLVASTVGDKEINKLAVLYNQRQGQILKFRRSGTNHINLGGSPYDVVIASLPGGAVEHGAFYAILGEPAPEISLAAMVDQLQATDLSWTEFPWPLIAGGLLVLVIIGMGLMYKEYNIPIQHLIADIPRLARREIGKLENPKIQGKFISIAKVINETYPSTGKVTAKMPARPLSSSQLEPMVESSALDHGMIALPEQPVTRGRSSPSRESMGSGIRSLQGFDAEDAGTELQTKPPSFLDHDQSPAFLPELRLSPHTEEDEKFLPQRTQGAASAAFDLEPSLSGFKPRIEPSSKRVIKIPASEEIELPPAEFPLLPLVEDNPLELADLSHSEDESLSDETFVDNKPITLPPLSGRGLQPELKAEIQISEQSRTTANIFAAVSQAQLAGRPPGETSSDPDEPYFREVFKEFLAIKRQCGENTSNLTFERFATKLRKNRASLMERFTCQSVKFQVYIKDGKAALKATPLREEPG